MQRPGNPLHLLLYVSLQASLETHGREALGLPTAVPAAWSAQPSARSQPSPHSEPAMRLTDASLVRGVVRYRSGWSRLEQCSRFVCTGPLLAVHLRSLTWLGSCPSLLVAQALMRQFKKQMCFNSILDLGFSAQQAQVGRWLPVDVSGGRRACKPCPLFCAVCLAVPLSMECSAINMGTCSATAMFASSSCRQAATDAAAADTERAAQLLLDGLPCSGAPPIDLSR